MGKKRAFYTFYQRNGFTGFEGELRNKTKKLEPVNWFCFQNLSSMFFIAFYDNGGVGGFDVSTLHPESFIFTFSPKITDKNVTLLVLNKLNLLWLNSFSCWSRLSKHLIWHVYPEQFQHPDHQHRSPPRLCALPSTFLSASQKTLTVKLLKSAVATTASGLILDGDESAYKQLVLWCRHNNCGDDGGL